MKSYVEDDDSFVEIVWTVVRIFSSITISLSSSSFCSCWVDKDVEEVVELADLSNNEDVFDLRVEEIDGKVTEDKGEVGKKLRKYSTSVFNGS